MPAILAEAFNNPYHTNTETMSSLSSLKNPAIKVSDIQTEADEIESVYNSIKARSPHELNNLALVRPSTDSLRSNQQHDCDMLISKLLGCAHCRLKIKEILSDSDTNPNLAEQLGGAGNPLGVEWNELGDIAINVVFGILIILVLDSLFKIKLKI